MLVKKKIKSKHEWKYEKALYDLYSPSLKYVLFSALEVQFTVNEKSVIVAPWYTSNYSMTMPCF